MFCDFSIKGEVIKISANFDIGQAGSCKCKASIIVKPDDGTDEETLIIRFDDIDEFTSFVKAVQNTIFLFTGTGCVDTIQEDCGFFEIKKYKPCS